MNLVVNIKILQLLRSGKSQTYQIKYGFIITGPLQPKFCKGYFVVNLLCFNQIGSVDCLKINAKVKLLFKIVVACECFRSSLCSILKKIKLWSGCLLFFVDGLLFSILGLLGSASC